MSVSDDSVGFSDTESNAENEEAKAADTTSGTRVTRRKQQKESNSIVHQVKTSHLLILLLGTMPFSTLQYLILPLNYP